MRFAHQSFAGSGAPAMQIMNICAKYSKIHVFIASWCHLFAIFTWWHYWF